MKQRLFILIFIAAIVAVLVGLNAASYAPAEKTPDLEALPHRSTFNSGATGLQAYYSLLAETGHNVTRWQQPPAALLTASERSPGVFIIAGRPRHPVTPPEAADLLAWVSKGGRLVIIDRDPPVELLLTTGNWQIRSDNTVDPAIYRTDPADAAQMTGGTAAIRPVQPTPVTYNVNAIQPSIFAGSVKFARFGTEEAGDEDPTVVSPDAHTVLSPSQAAPFVHIASPGKNLLVESPYGEGMIVILTDPFIAANGGIALADNSVLAINLAASDGRPIAFDEYHQGYGADSNRFLQFFAGTPVIAIFLQTALLIGLLFSSQSRRFARPVPEPEPDRLSKLEYVAAMAELQRRTKAYDLAVENIYSDFRRRAARNLGRDNLSLATGELAAGIAERIEADRYDLEATLHRCEEIVRGEAASRSDVLELVSKIRELESRLGLTRARGTRI
jgi:hypothetical protein